MNQNLIDILNKYQNLISTATNSQELEKIRVEILGRNGLLNDLFSKIKDIPNQDKKQYGQDLNELKTKLEELINKQPTKTTKNTDNCNLKIDNSIFSLEKRGHLHPITITENSLNEVFRSLGFSIYDGPEIETDEFNFQRLNVPLDHPARDMQDTIYIDEPKTLLRTQGSAIEAELLSQQKPPFRCAFPCEVFRNEKVNKSNHFIFHHYQAVVVDKGLTMKDLIGTMDKMFKALYGDKVVVRYRCKYYPEVEPGVGPDMQCFQCGGKGCPMCKHAGWIEMGGSGMIHPNVLKKAGIDPKIYSGFAFGMGLDRWAMVQNNIKDIRTLQGGNLAYKPN